MIELALTYSEMDTDSKLKKSNNLLKLMDNMFERSGFRSANKNNKLKKLIFKKKFLILLGFEEKVDNDNNNNVNRKDNIAEALPEIIVSNNKENIYKDLFLI